MEPRPRRSLAGGRRLGRWGGLDPGLAPNSVTFANNLSRSSADLAAEVFPQVPVRKQLGRHETMLSIDKAGRVRGYQPEHSWRG